MQYDFQENLFGFVVSEIVFKLLVMRNALQTMQSMVINSPATALKVLCTSTQGCHQLAQHEYRKDELISGN